jgi:hypothetical protein
VLPTDKKICLALPKGQYQRQHDAAERQKGMKHGSIGDSNCYSDSNHDAAITTAAAMPQQQTVFIRSATVADKNPVSRSNGVINSCHDIASAASGSATAISEYCCNSHRHSLGKECKCDDPSPSKTEAEGVMHNRQHCWSHFQFR